MIADVFSDFLLMKITVALAEPPANSHCGPTPFLSLPQVRWLGGAMFRRLPPSCGVRVSFLFSYISVLVLGTGDEAWPGVGEHPPHHPVTPGPGGFLMLALPCAWTSSVNLSVGAALLVWLEWIRISSFLPWFIFLASLSSAGAELIQLDQVPLLTEA